MIRGTLRRCAKAIPILLAVGASPLTAQDNAADSAWLVDVLGLGANSIVADIGAGAGELSLAIAAHVAPNGRVFASELGDESVERLSQAVASAGGGNVTVIEGHPDRTNLPAGCCDAIFVRFVYHHFADPPAMNTSLLKSLRPGGRLAVIDFAPRGTESPDPSGRTAGEQHGVTADTLSDELEQAGFIIVSTEQRPDRLVYVVAQKPVRP